MVKMASDRPQPSTTTTTTTSSTTTYMIQNSRRPRSQSNTGPPPSSSASSRNLLTTASPDNVGSPQASSTNNANIASTEPFPSFQTDPNRISQLSQVHTIDHYPLTNVTTRSSVRLAPTTTSTQMRRRPIGIKRLSSQNSTPQLIRSDTAQTSGSTWEGRRRSTSAPQRPTMLEESQDGEPLQHATTASINLPALVEGQEYGAHRQPGRLDVESQNRPHAEIGPTRSRGGSQRLRRASDAARSAVSRMSNRSEDQPTPAGEYEEGIVDILDVIDPEVSTLTTLTNVQNSLFVPDFGRWLNRRPTFELTKGPSYRSQRPTLNRGNSKPLPATPSPVPVPPKDTEISIPSDIEEEAESSIKDGRLSLQSVPSIASVLQEEHYAVLPHGISLDGWSEEDKDLLDDYVRHMLHSKREGFKRSMRAFGKYVRKPLGFFVTLYAVLITLFGLAWVLFLIGWIYVGEKQLYVINIIDNVLVALFAVVGDGMIPWRLVDSYHMSFIAYYHHKTEKIRQQRKLPELQDHNELPEIHETEVDVENAIKEGDAEFSVLTPEQQKTLEHHQFKFAKSHSYYKPHETITHHAFPHRLSVAIVFLLDMHSVLQVALGTTTWSTNYLTRPKALTPTILSCSITVNITAGILIKIGDNKTRKKDVLKRMFRQQLTEEAMRRVEREKEERKESLNTQQREEEEALRAEKEGPNDRIQEESDSNRFSSASVAPEYSPEVPEKSTV